MPIRVSLKARFFISTDTFIKKIVFCTIYLDFVTNITNGLLHNNLHTVLITTRNIDLC